MIVTAHVTGTILFKYSIQAVSTYTLKAYRILLFLPADLFIAIFTLYFMPACFACIAAFVAEVN